MTAIAHDPEAPGTRRLARLADRAGALRARRDRGGRDERWLLVVGGTAMPLGLVLILLGWYGAARTVLPFEQTPYLISGGLLGLALVIGGGLLYFAYWLTLQVREARADRERVAAHHDRLERAITDLAALLAPEQHAATRSARVVTTAAGTLLHRPDCRATAGLQVTEVPYDEDDLALCGLCQPAPPPARPAALARTPAPARSRAPRAARASR